MPVAEVQQPEKLILPPPATDPLAARRPARSQAPVYPATQGDPRRRVPARRDNRNSALGLSVIIGLVFIILTGVIFYAVYSRANKNPAISQTPTATTGSSPTSTFSPTPNPSPSPTPRPSPTPHFGATATSVASQAPLLTDSLSSDTNGSWSNDGQTCSFQNGTYHVLGSQASFLHLCPDTNFPTTNRAIKLN